MYFANESSDYIGKEIYNAVKLLRLVRSNWCFLQCQPIKSINVLQKS